MDDVVTKPVKEPESIENGRFVEGQPKTYIDEIVS